MSGVSASTLKVLHIVNTLDAAGIETWLLNVARQNTLQNACSMHFLSISDREGLYDKEITSLGCTIHRIDVKTHRNPFAFFKSYRALLSRENVHLIHGHTYLHNGYYAWGCRSLKIPFISHAHTTRHQSEGIQGIKNRILYRLNKRIPGFKAACSLDAYHSAFGALDPKEGTVIHYGIDHRKFSPSTPQPLSAKIHGSLSETSVMEQPTRKSVADEPTSRSVVEPLTETSVIDQPTDTSVIDQLTASLSGKIVLGHVGRFVDVKNHDFLLQIMQELKNRGDDRFHLCCVGDGPLLEPFRQKTAQLGLQHLVSTPGVRQDTHLFFTGLFDCLLLPSKFEGFGIVTLEAQCAGINVMVSSHITREIAVIPELVTRLPIDNTGPWVTGIQQLQKRDYRERMTAFGQFEKSEFTIAQSLNALIRLYTKVLNHA